MFSRFLVVGACNTAIGLSLIWTFQYFGMPPVAANAAGYFAGFAFGFALNKLWTFRHVGPVWPAFARYGAAFVLSYLANLAVLIFALGALGQNSYVAQLIAMLAYTIVFYAACRHFALR